MGELIVLLVVESIDYMKKKLKCYFIINLGYCINKLIG